MPASSARPTEMEGIRDRPGHAPRRVALIAPPSLLRYGLRRTLEDLGWLEVTGPADGVRPGIDLLERVQPDCVLLWLFDDPDLAKLREAAPDAGFVLVLEWRRPADELRRIVDTHQFRGLLLPVDTRAYVENVLSAAIRGRELLPAWLGKSDDLRAAVPFRLASALTSRQQEVLELMAHGKGDAGIAESLGMALSTAKSHVSAVLRRLDVHDRRAASDLYWAEQEDSSPRP